MMLRYIGFNRHGNPVTGSTEKRTATELAEEKYKAGWRELFIKDDSGEVVGFVGRNTEGKRTWWAEK